MTSQRGWEIEQDLSKLMDIVALIQEIKHLGVVGREDMLHAVISEIGRLTVEKVAEDERDY